MISKNKIKYIRSLELKKNRNKEGKFVAEGFKVVDDLLALQPADLIVATQEWLHGKHLADQTEVIEVTEEELKKVSFLQHPQQVLAVFRQDTGCNKQDSNNSQEDAEDKNFGFSKINTQELSLAWMACKTRATCTIIRIATGLASPTSTAVRILPTCITRGGSGHDGQHCESEGGIWQPAGSSRIAACRCTVYGTLLDGDNIYQQQLENRGLIVMGNEGKGISPALAKKVNRRLLIPNFPEGRATADSLNVAIATAITCSEFRRNF